MLVQAWHDFFGVQIPTKVILGLISGPFFFGSIVVVPIGRRDTGIFPLGRASRPSMARSGADVLSAYGPRGKIPVSRLDIVRTQIPVASNLKSSPVEFLQNFMAGRSDQHLQLGALGALDTNAAAEPGGG